MIPPLTPPEGFSVVGGESCALIARDALIEPLGRLGLAWPRGWASRLTTPIVGSGRGSTARLEVLPNHWVRLKQLRRGGLAGPLWRDRFAGAGRVLENLTLPLEVGRRGIATPAPQALLVAAGPAGMFQGWLALDEISGGADLRSRFVSGPAPSREELAACLALVRRMHDAGVEHRDLNLGNLLLRSGPGGEPQPFVLDLDKARPHAEPLGPRARRRALRRLERSLVKVLTPHGGVTDAARDALYELYSAGDAGLQGYFARGRAVGRLLLALHRLGWRG